MNRSLALVFLFVLSFGAYGAIIPSSSDSKYDVTLNVGEVLNDRLFVHLSTPAVTAEEIEFHMPKIVPGTYNVSDFGRFVSSLKAYDTSGAEIPVEKIGVNRWNIRNANTLSAIEYYIDDTFDGDDGRNVFEPGGSNFQEDTNFVLNLFAMIGYLDGLEDVPYQVNVAHPRHLYGVTALEVLERSTTVDRFSAPDYFTMHDSPIMYSAPDTASLQVANARVEVMVYSPNNVLSAKEVMDRNRDLFMAAADYLGGDLPVERYAQLIYLWDGPSNSGGMGALEHSYSTVFSMPELPDSVVGQEMRNVTAHEFFHIVTPLTIHSEEIHDYNWIEPQMSEHLWLYEGVTEYSAHHMQVKAGLISPEEFLSIMQDKMSHSTEHYDDQIPFTTMSAHCLDVYQDQYANVYQKGALIGMCLDLELLEWSEGTYGIQDLIKDLQARYGAERAFKDEELFDVIAELTYPEIRDFFTRHLESYEALPFEEALAAAGVAYTAEVATKTITFGNIPLGYNPNTGRLFIANLERANEFASAMGYEVGDEFISINGYDLTDLQSISDNIDAWQAATKDGDKVRVQIARKKDGEFQEITLKGKAMEIDTTDNHHVELIEDASAAQMKVRNSWLNSPKM